MAVNSENEIYPCNKKGVCVIFTNFYGKKVGTAHLPGYVGDRRELIEYFKDVLKYDVITETGGTKLLNLSCKQFDLAMESLQKELTGRLSKDATSFDRFIMFILSHGGQPGICMCEEGSNGEKFEADEDGHTIYKPVEEIIESFSNEYIPKLAGIPKCFIIQACRGRSYLQPAADSYESESIDPETKQITIKSPSVKKANIIVAHATLDTTLSYLGCHSLFINDIIGQLRQTVGKDDVLQIFTKVISKFSEKELSEKFFKVNQPDIDVKILHEGQLCPLLIYGKQENNDEMPLLPTEKQYRYFAPCRQANQNLDQYVFTGKVEFCKKKMHQNMEVNNMPADLLKAFADAKYFKIFGKMEHKNTTQSSNQTQAETKIIITGNRFEMVKRKDFAQGLALDVYGYKYVNGQPIKVEATELNGKEAWLFIDNQLYHHGKLTQYGNVWGLFAPRYQLPIVTTTLTKKMYLTVPPVLQPTIQSVSHGGPHMQESLEVPENIANYVNIKIATALQNLCVQQPLLSAVKGLPDTKLPDVQAGSLKLNEASVDEQKGEKELSEDIPGED